MDLRLSQRHCAFGRGWPSPQGTGMPRLQSHLSSQPAQQWRDQSRNDLPKMPLQLHGRDLTLGQKRKAPRRTTGGWVYCPRDHRFWSIFPFTNKLFNPLPFGPKPTNTQWTPPKPTGVVTIPRKIPLAAAVAAAASASVYDSDIPRNLERFLQEVQDISIASLQRYSFCIIIAPFVCKFLVSLDNSLLDL